MKKIKVLFVSHSPELGGAEKNLLDILSNLDKDIFEGYLLLPKRGLLGRDAERLGVNVFIVNYKSWIMQKIFSWKYFFYIPINIISIFKIKSLIRKLDIDIVYTNTSTVISGAIASKISRKPHIWSIHEAIGKQKESFRLLFFNRLVFTIIGKLSQHIIVNSDFIKRNFPCKYVYKISVVYNGFDINSYFVNNDEKTTLRRKYGIKEDEKVLSVIGTICNRKGQREAILSMPLILKKDQGFRLVIVGRAFKSHRQYEKEIHGIVKSHGLEKNVTFIGFKENITEIYKITNYLLVPSLIEPFGRVIVEAMLFGVPVVATRTGGMPEIVQDGYSGQLISSREPETIANAVFSMIDFPAKTQTYAENAKIEARKRFSLDTMNKKLTKILLETAARHPIMGDFGD